MQESNQIDNHSAHDLLNLDKKNHPHKNTENQLYYKTVSQIKVFANIDDQFDLEIFKNFNYCCI